MDKKLKIGILTFYWSNDNYGQLLQCYALQKYLMDRGYNAYLIRYNHTTRDIAVNRLKKAVNPVKVYNYILKKIARKNSINYRMFDDFRNKYIISSREYESYKELKSNPPEADIYIVGSDQVWNFSNFDIKKNKDIVHAFFLDFGNPETKRLSYAASWGTKSVEEDFIKEISPLIRKFDYVSVRERSGLELCKECGYNNAELRCDPTLLNSPELYRDLYRENTYPKQDKKYVLVYRINNQCDFDMDRICNWAKDKELETVYVTANDLVDRKHNQTYATIPQWLYLIDNAEYVITNSFHGSLFSLLFNTKFAVIPLKGKVEGMNSRLDTLFEIFNIAPRYLKDDFTILDTPMQPKLKSDTNFDLSKIIAERE